MATPGLNELLKWSVEKGASDLHVAAGMPPLLRVDGEIRSMDLPVLDAVAARSLIHAGMSESRRQDYAASLETDFALELPEVGRFRVNAFVQNRGAAAVFRTIPAQVPTMGQLGLSEVFREICTRPGGLVCVTGATGSGKSTTLAAMIDHINDARRQHILTIEDPIEFVHQSRNCLVNQREVQRDTHGFNEALRAALREDPDVILVGELRDLETIRLALTAAETGHLVLATVHTRSASGAVDRLVDVFPAGEKEQVRSMLSTSLQAVVSQTLLKKRGGGRVAAHEIMICTGAIRNLIRENKAAQMVSVLQTGAAHGMQTLDQCLRALLAAGLIERDEARAKAHTPRGF